MCHSGQVPIYATDFGRFFDRPYSFVKRYGMG